MTARRRTSAPRSRTLRQRAPQSWPCWTISNHDVERVVSRWGRSTVRAAHGDPALGTGRVPARLGVRLPGRGTRPRGSGRAVRGAARSVRHRVLARVQGPRRLPHADALGCERARAASPAPSPGCRCRISTCSCRWPRRSAIASSALHGFRRLLEWRKQHPLLISGDIEFLAATDSVLAFRRFDASGALLAAFNLSGEAGQRAAARCQGGRMRSADTVFPRAALLTLP